jgi:GT2 family glycosyltransferase
MISVIVSNFNGLRFLPRLLESLRAQRGVESEIIIVDRLSTDGSGEYLASQPDVRVLSERPETGLVSGYATGATVARGELLFFCNEDMCLRVGKKSLERIVAQSAHIAEPVLDLL